MHHRCRSARVFDTQSGASLLAIDGRKARFSSLWWDSMHKQLVLGDTTGHVAIWDVASERQLVDEKLCDGEVREVSTAGSELLASSDDTCGVWRVLRELQYLEAKGHTGAVVALASSGEPSAAGGGEPVLYSAGYDNTIQLWDPYDMQSMQVMGRHCHHLLLRTRHLHLHLTSSTHPSVQTLREESVGDLVHGPLRRVDFLVTGNDDTASITHAAPTPARRTGRPRRPSGTSSSSSTRSPPPNPSSVRARTFPMATTSRPPSSSRPIGRSRRAPPPAATPNSAATTRRSRCTSD